MHDYRITWEMYKTVKRKCTFYSFSLYTDGIMWYIGFGKVFFD